MSVEVPIDALFVLECGCVMDGCSGSHPSQVWQSGKTGKLYCFQHRHWELLIDVVIAEGAI